MNAAAHPVILLEFNELTPWLMDRFIAEGHLPNFRRLREQSLVGVSDAKAEGEWLNPWVQWVTIHSGRDHRDHGIFRLSDAPRMETPAVWDLLSDAGLPVWVCGSMNAWYSVPLNGHVLPDPWCQNVLPWPRGEFDHFYRFVQANVQEHANVRASLEISDIVAFLRYMVGHGLSLSTARGILRQLVAERLGNQRWKRASAMDALQYDVFARYYRRHRPAFSTFFLNSTAYYQHRFWRNMVPEEFQIKPSAGDQRDYRHAIRYGYETMDRLVGRFLRLAPDATIMLISGLGQQSYSDMDIAGGKRVYRLQNGDVLSDLLGVTGAFRYEPIMADEFFLRFESEADARACADRLAGFRLPSGHEAFDARVQGRDVIGQCRCRELMGQDARLAHPDTGGTVPFHEVFYRVDCIKSGHHHPEGVLWVRLPSRRHAVIEQPVDLTAIAPTVLELLGVDRPEFMTGRSFLAGNDGRRGAGAELAAAVP